MKITRVITICIAFAGFAAALACGEKTGNGNSAVPPTENRRIPSTPQKEEISEEISALVNLPFEPEDTVWRKSPDGKSLVAVMRFSPEDAKKLRQQLEAGGRGSLRSIPPEDWFPTELTAQSEASPEAVITGTAFPASPFYQPPFNDGTVTVVPGTEFFILELKAG